MSVEELQALHRRYVALSQRFRSAWVFHQFLQSLAKLYLDSFDDRYPDRFQELYGHLKEISESLNASQAAGLAGQFDGVERQLGELIDALVAEDSRVDPSHLRRFFRRFRTYDEKVLIQLIRFYLHAHHGESWEPDRLDKIDYLLTRLSEEGLEGDDTAATGLAGRGHLREVLRGLRLLLPAAQAPPITVEERKEEIESLRREIAGVGDLDTLHDRALVQRYRALKHGLGDLFFEPDLTLAVLETNQAVKRAIKTLYAREERRIFTEYQEIFDLEGTSKAGGGKLTAELDRLRQDVERFEEHLQRDEMRLADLAEIRQRVRALMPRLTGEDGGPVEEPPPASQVDPEATFGDLVDDEPSPQQVAADPHDATVPFSSEPEGDLTQSGGFGVADGVADGAAADPEATAVPAGAEDEGEAAASSDQDGLVHGHFGLLVAALDGTTLGSPPRAASLTPDVYQYRLEPREVIAYRRLLRQGTLSPTAPPDEDWGAGLERFLLLAAALRVRMTEEVEEIRSILDETASDTGAPIFERARKTVRLGDAYLNRFSHLIHQLLLDDDSTEARELEVLRVRLMREYAGLWLLAYKRLVTEIET